MSPTVPDSDLPAAMRAALLLGTGGPEMLVVRDDVGVPSPGRGDVLVRVAACGMNNTDINTRVGWYSRAVTSATSGEGFNEAGVHDSGWGRRGLSFPRIQGADIAGVVVAAGDGADAGLLRRRVLVDPWLRDRDRPGDRELAGYLGSERDALTGRSGHGLAQRLARIVVKRGYSLGLLAVSCCRRGRGPRR